MQTVSREGKDKGMCIYSIDPNVIDSNRKLDRFNNNGNI